MKSIETTEATRGPVAIRPAIVADAGWVATVLTECFHPPVGLNQLLQPWIQSSLKSDLSRRLQSPQAFYTCLVAIAGDRPIGTVEVALRPLPQQWWLPGLGERERFVYVSNLAVSPHFRRLGIARNLLIEVEQFARRWNRADISLHAMENNDGALNLYRALGYRQERAEQEFLFVGPRKLLMSKRLTS